MPSGRSLLRPCASVLLLLLALVLAGCATGAPVQLETDLSPKGGCRAEHVMHEHLSRHPGVQVSRAGDVLRVRIRDAPQEPLYVVDGQPLAATPGAVLSAVNPCDIQEIRVLRDAADVTFYGLRGANGVILITTRR
jgi:TonB-dependent SusC/RagA subfamily outer membrane receptor